MKRLLPLLFLGILLALPSTASAQWTYAGAFPDSAALARFGGNGTHGIAVDPDGKIWIQPFGATDSVLVPKFGANRATNVIYVFNPDGTPASFSPIKILSGAVSDTLGGFVNAAGNWETKSGRGLRTDADGNILAAQFTTLYRLNYETGAAMNKLPTTAALTAPAVDANGNIFVANVSPGAPIRIYDSSFNFVENAVDSSRGFSRAFAVSPDGNTIYWAGYTNHAIYQYSRPDEFSPFEQIPDTVLKGFDSESFVWHPTTGDLWLSAGSPNDLPNRFPGAETAWQSNTWYAFDTDDLETPTDSIVWFGDFGIGRPRGIAFSPDGRTAYVAEFSQSAASVQKFTNAGNVATEPDHALPQGFALDQNYPNPFNPSTEISFSLHRNGLATLKVFDVTGREVATLVDGQMPAGEHTVRFDARNLPSGAYLYVLAADGYRLTGKMLLVK